MSLPDTFPPTADTLTAALHAQASQLRIDLQPLLDLPIDEQLGATELAGQMEATLKTFWNGRNLQGTLRYQALASSTAQALHNEVALKIHDGALVEGFRQLLPTGQADPALLTHALYLPRHEQPGIEVHGALLFSRDAGACLLHLPGYGIEGFASQQALRSQVAQWLAEPAMRSLLLRNTSLEFQQAVAGLDADADLFSTVDSPPLILMPLLGDPLLHIIKRQITRQRQDVAWVCRQQALREADQPRWRLALEAALRMHDLLGPAPMLRLRDSERALRGQRARIPEWLRHLEPDQRRQWLDSLLAYEQARLALNSQMQGCASARQFASTRLTARLHNDLGYDLDPEQVMVTTRRRSPIGNQAYEQHRSLNQLALHGLHSTDQRPDSDFQTHTNFSLDGQPLAKAYPRLTATWLATTLARLDLRMQFGEAQRRVLGDSQVKAMMSLVLHRQMIVQARAALHQGHLQQVDAPLLDALLGNLHSGSLQVQQVRLNQERLSNLLLLRLISADGNAQRLILYSHDSPRAEQWRGFDNERQLLLELVGWSAVTELRDYLLGQVPSSRRPGLAAQLQALANKAQPSSGLLDFISHPDLDDGLHAMTTAQIRLLIDTQRQHTPDWLLAASASQRQELQGLEEVIEQLTRDYQAQPHTQAPNFNAFVRQMASQRINALLGQPDGTVDPDRIIITSPRETLSYSAMLRDGYDDSIGFLTATADTQATFSGPPGIDLSPLTPEKAAGSVRGAWPGDAWIAQVRATLLNPQDPGYEYRRRLSLLLVQLQMRSAALRSLLTRQITASQHAWLSQSIDRMHDDDPQSRQRYPVYPLRFRLDNPFIGSSFPALGEVLNSVSKVIPDGVPVSRLETALGCHILCPAGEPDQALLYTPNAPDGLAFRPLSRFIETLRNDGMSDYYKDRCHRVMSRTLAFYFIDLKQRADSPPPSLPEQPCSDLQEVCYNRVLQRKLRDVEDTTEGRGDMIARQVMNGIELVAVALTLPFPPASFAVGAALVLRDSTQALAALSEGDHAAASMHMLGAWLNLFGAAGDASVGLKGFGGLLRQLADRNGHNPALTAVKQLRGHTPLHRAAPHDAQKLLASGYFDDAEVAGLLHPLAPEHRLPVMPGQRPAPAHAVQQSLAGTTPFDSGHARGVTLIDGRYYIELDAQVYQVQYDARLRRWQIIDPANPYAFFGKQPVQLTDSGKWKVADNLHLRGGGDTEYSPLGLEPGQPVVVPSTLSAYEMPDKWNRHVLGAADLTWAPLEDLGMALPRDFFAHLFKEGRELYATLRERLRKDALAFFEQPALAGKADLPGLAEDMTADDLLKTVLGSNPGLVISEASQSVASKRLLIENMPRLVEQGVGVIYVEHLFTDQHLRKLHKYLTQGARTSAGSVQIKAHLEALNQGILFNGHSHKFDYYHLIKAAHRHGIEIRPFSSSVSYNFVHSTAPVADAAQMRMMSLFFGSRLIAADVAQNPARRWVALLDQRLANAHEHVPGIAELHGAISIRVQDVASDQPLKVTRDLRPASATGTDSNVSRADFQLQMANPRSKPAKRYVVLASSEPDPSSAAADNLDFALAQSLNRPGVQRARPSLSRQLIQQPGPHGFQLDSVGNWSRAEAATWPETREATALQRSLADPLYQMPEAHLAEAHDLVFFEHRGLNIFYHLENHALSETRSLFFSLRARLQRDAQALLSQPLPTRPNLPDVTGLGHSELLDTLYAQTRGLVIGESRDSIASKQFIIDNLPHLSRRQVKTLYIEHLQADMHQADLDLFFEKGLMSKRLLHYLRHLDQSFFTDPARVYNFEQLVIKARTHGIEVRALDCMASYYIRNMPSPGQIDRILMMNHFASRAIHQHQQVMGAHNWLALVGETHANTFAGKAPGIADLHQGISLRIHDVKAGDPTGPTGDPGRIARDAPGRQQTFIRNDYVLGLPTQYGPVTLSGQLTSEAATSPQALLHMPGMFMVEGLDSSQPVIIHRTRNNLLEHTQVQRNVRGKVYIDRQTWPGVHLQRFDNLMQLLEALKEMNMQQVLKP